MISRVTLYGTLVLAGFGLGLIFYGGLLATIHYLPNARRPAALVLCSYLGRAALVVTGFALLMGRKWQNAVACLAGFVLGRVVLTRIPRFGKRTV